LDRLPDDPVDAEIRVDPDPLGVERRMMELRQRQAIRDDRDPIRPHLPPRPFLFLSAVRPTKPALP